MTVGYLRGYWRSLAWSSRTKNKVECLAERQQPWNGKGEKWLLRSCGWQWLKLNFVVLVRCALADHQQWLFRELMSTGPVKYCLARRLAAPTCVITWTKYWTSTFLSPSDRGQFFNKGQPTINMIDMRWHIHSFFWLSMIVWTLYSKLLPWSSLWARCQHYFVIFWPGKYASNIINCVW